MENKRLTKIQIIIMVIAFMVLAILFWKIIEGNETKNVQTENLRPEDIEPIATSQDKAKIDQETSTPEERTGITCIGSFGAAAVLDNLSDTAITICGWTDIFLTEEEMKLLYTTVFCEAGNQGYEAQKMVALVILNRLNSDKFPDTLREVVYQEGQFAVTKWPDFESKGWTGSVQDAVDHALQYNEYPRDMYYFRAKYYHSFGEPYVYIAETYFSLEGGK